MRRKFLFTVSLIWEVFQIIGNFFQSIYLWKKVTVEGVILIKTEGYVLEPGPSGSKGNFALSYPVSYMNAHKHFITVRRKFDNKIISLIVEKPYYKKVNEGDDVSIPCVKFLWDYNYIPMSV